jgi:pimeloyl-ACP methyl ester carboxylesterase
MKTIKSKTVLFVTGAFVSNSCWDQWRMYFESKGYTTTAPPWPHKEGSAKALRDKRPNDVPLAQLTMEEMLEHYVNIAKGLPEKPIVIGHSFGGLITQIIVNRDLAAAGIAIHSAPPKGILPYEFSFLKAGWKLFGFFTSLKKTYLMSFKDWQYAFVNEMPLEEQKRAYEMFTIPESKTAARGALTDVAKVDFNKKHVPLLFMAGSIDHTMPPHLNFRNFNRYRKNGSVLEYKEFPGRNHFVLGQSTWKENADYILDWVASH